MKERLMRVPDLRRATSTRMLAHLSDLHVGRSAADDAQAEQLAHALLEIGVDHVVVTGDLTHRGRRSELEQFRRAFAGLLGSGRVTVVPGNHDRLGDDLGDDLMPGGRVQVASAAGLYLIRVNSTGAHNRSWIAGHGALLDDDLDDIDRALDAAPRDHMVVVALHHHVLQLPDEHPMERLSSFLGWPFTGELARGRALLERLRGRCPLVLHGHRHMPRGVRLWNGALAVSVFNAGSSTELGGARVFEHVDGALVGGPWWLEASALPGRGVSWAASPTVAHGQAWQMA
jgi:Icc protein